MRRERVWLVTRGWLWLVGARGVVGWLVDRREGVVVCYEGEEAGGDGLQGRMSLGNGSRVGEKREGVVSC